MNIIYDPRLDPCKHCGGEPYVRAVDNRSDYGRIICSDCGMETPCKQIRDKRGKRTLEQLMSIWNAEAPAPAADGHTGSPRAVAVEVLDSDDPLMRIYRYPCCGYQFREPLCVAGYRPVSKSHCPSCGRQTTAKPHV